jgi:hypothetical protein
MTLSILILALSLEHIGQEARARATTKANPSGTPEGPERNGVETKGEGMNRAEANLAFKNEDFVKECEKAERGWSILERN